jgi:hypothetical protein
MPKIMHGALLPHPNIPAWSGDNQLNTGTALYFTLLLISLQTFISDIFQNTELKFL